MKKRLTSNVDFDTLKPDVVLKHFCSAVNVMKEKYEYDVSRLSELEANLEDLLNYIEMVDVEDMKTRAEIYDKLSDIKNEIKMRKNEAMMLEPVYNVFGQEVVDVIMAACYDCRDIKHALEKQSYTIKTDVVDKFCK